MKHQHSNIDFNLVTKITNKIIQGDYSVVENNNYPLLEREVAILAAQENSLLDMLRPLIVGKNKNFQKLMSKMDGDKVNFNDVIIQGLSLGYSELATNQKHELLPLFFSPDMKSEKSVYLSKSYNKILRDFFYKEYLKLIKKDKLNIKNLKQEYLNTHKLSYLLPLNKHLGKEIISKNNIEPTQKVSFP